MASQLEHLKKVRIRFFSIVFVICIFLLVISYLYFSHETERIKDSKYSYLSAVSSLKLRQIEQWRNERNGDIDVITRSPLFVNAVNAWIDNQSSTGLSNSIIMQLDLLKNNYGYENVFLTSNTGEVLLGDTRLFEPNDELLQAINDAFQSKDVVFTDIYLSHATLKPRIDIVSPILTETGTAIVSIVFQINPYTKLYPLIESWPDYSETAETIIVRKDGDFVIVLNQPKHTTNLPLKQKISIQLSEVVAVKAVLGISGRWEGLDYRGESILADIQPIEGTNWFIISKIDRREIYSELYDHGILLSLLLLVSFALISGIFYWIYKYKHYNTLLELNKLDSELKGQENVFRAALYSIGEGLIITDADGVILKMNHVAETLLGLSEKDVKEVLLNQIFKISTSNNEDVEHIISNVLKTGKTQRLAFGTSLQLTGDGSIPVSGSMSPILDGQGTITGIALVFRDQSIELIAHTKLKESEEKFRKSFKTYPDAVTITRLSDGKFLNVNDGFTKLFGFKNSDTGGKTTEELGVWQNSADRARFTELLMENHEIENFPVKITTKENEVKECIVSAALIEISGETYILSIAKDVSKIMTTETALEISLTKYKTLFDSFPLGITVSDKEGNIKEGNKMAEDLLGVSVEEQLRRQIGSNVWKIVRTDGTNMPAEEFASVRALKENTLVKNVEMGIVKGGGEITWINVTAAPLPLEDFGVIVTYSDISERRRMELALQESEAKFRMMAENANDWIYWLTPERNFQFISPSCEKITGYTPEEFIENPDLLNSIVHPDDMPHIGCHSSENMGSPKVHDIQFRIVKRNGDIRWVSHSCIPIFGEDHRFKGRCGTNRDITERKLVEEKTIKLNVELESRVRERTAMLEASNKELEAFSHSVAHDLRAPLRGIDGFAQILADDYGVILGEEGIRICSVIQKNIQNMGQLIDNLLMLSRLARVNLKPQLIDTKEMVEEVYKELTNAETRKKIDFKVEVLTNVEVDPVLFRQVWINLIDNALKYSSPRQTQEISISCQGRNSECIFCIRDNGVGFDMKFHDQVFEVFQRVHKSSEFEGTGVGLAIVQRIINKHGGAVWAEGKIDQGASFFFSIPQYFSTLKEHLPNSHEDSRTH